MNDDKCTQPGSPQSPSFAECVWACWDNPTFMQEYRRLTGHRLGQAKRSALEFMIDRATGYKPDPLDDDEVRAFFEFVRDCVWLPLFFQRADFLRRSR